MLSTSTRLTRRTVMAASLLAGFGIHPTVARQATPEADEPFMQRASALLEMISPRELTEHGGIAFYYADLAGQLSATGVPRPEPRDAPGDLPSGFAEATVALPLAARAFQSAMAPEWRETFGFNPYAAGQTLDVTDEEALVTIIHGGFDRAEVESALEASGYDLVLQESGGPYWTFGDEIDFDTAVGRLGVGAMNQAIVDAEVLIFAREAAIIEQVSQVRAGFQPSALEQGMWPDLLRHFSDDLVGMAPLDPTRLLTLPQAEPGEHATPMATPAPEDTGLVMIGFGVRAGAVSKPIALGGEGTPVATPQPVLDAQPARVEIRLRYTNADLAAQEVEAIADRWMTMESVITGERFNDLMALDDARIAADDATVVALDFTAEAPNMWVRMVHAFDLTPLLPAQG